MAKKRARAAKSGLEQTAVKIGTTLGKATRAARSLGESAPQTKKELKNLRKSLGALAKELERAADRVKKALR